MELQFTFFANGLRMPFAGNQILQGLVYWLLARDPAYSGFVHDRGYRSGGRPFKLFVFAPLRGRYVTEGKTLIFPEDVVFAVRSESGEFLERLRDGCRVGERCELNDQQVLLRQLALLPTPALSGPLRIRTRSPVTVHTTTPDRHTRYYAPEEGEFYARILANARRKWDSLYAGEPFELALEAVPGAPARRIVTTFKGVYITAWHGEFLLSGSPRALAFLYNTGLGDRNSQGFGMFDPIPSSVKRGCCITEMW